MREKIREILCGIMCLQEEMDMCADLDNAGIPNSCTRRITSATDKLLSLMQGEWISVEDKLPYNMWIGRHGKDWADRLIDTFEIYWGGDLDDPHVTVGDYVSNIGWCYYGSVELLPRQEQITHWREWKPEPPKEKP